MDANRSMCELGKEWGVKFKIAKSVKLAFEIGIPSFCLDSKFEVVKNDMPFIESCLSLNWMPFFEKKIDLSFLMMNSFSWIFLRSSSLMVLALMIALMIKTYGLIKFITV